jgi:O-antigen/teichoic acid export membrane protein
MNRPPLKTRIAGHALVVGPLSLLAVWSVYALSQDTNRWPMTVLAVMLAGWSLNANEVMARYKAWQRAWNSMAPARPRSVAIPWRKLGAVVAIALPILYLGAHPERPGYSMALGGLIIGLLGLLLARLWQWVRHRKGRARQGDELVRVTVRRPLLPVPSLAQAYAALPDYCQHVLQGR